MSVRLFKFAVVAAAALVLTACNSAKDAQSQAAADACRYLKSQSFNKWQQCAFGRLDSGNYSYNTYEIQLRAVARYLGEQERLKRITTAEAFAQMEYQYSQIELGAQQQQAAAWAQAGARMQAAGAALSAAGATSTTNVYVQPTPRTCYRNGNYVNCY